MTTEQMDELGQALINIAALTPKGMVVFVPSYDFLDQIQSRWEKTGARQRLAAKKEVRHGDQAELVLRLLHSH
jgi:chromosome transmission fidelity protein 1